MRDCFPVSLDRFSYANFYLIFRKKNFPKPDKFPTGDETDSTEPKAEKLLPDNFDIAIYPKFGVRCCESLLRGKLNFPE